MGERGEQRNLREEGDEHGLRRDEHQDEGESQRRDEHRNDDESWLDDIETVSSWHSASC